MNTSKVDNRLDYVPDEANDVLISVNPKAGARSSQTIVVQAAEMLRESGYQVEIPPDIDRLAETAAAKLENGTLRAVVAAGGDGTVSLVVNRTLPGVPVIVLPLGTENLLAKYLKLKAEPASLCETIRRGAFVRLDAAQANERIMLLMLSAGFDAAVVQRVEQKRSGHIRRRAYVKPIFEMIRSYEYPELRIYLDLEEQSAATGPQIIAKWSFVVNLPCYAMGLGIAPDAVGTDGKLDVCTFKEGSLWKGLKYLTGVVMRRHEKWDDCVTRRVRRIRIESDAQVPYQVDGDIGGYLPVDIEVLPQRLTLLVPEDWQDGKK